LAHFHAYKSPSSSSPFPLFSQAREATRLMKFFIRIRCYRRCLSLIPVTKEGNTARFRYPSPPLAHAHLLDIFFEFF
jgi:hypothetical protein